MKDTEQCAEMGNIYISSEQIIQEVQKFRCLYDPADPDHKDRDVMRDAWLSVTQAVVGEPWANLNSAEKNEAEKELKRRWRDMKDALRKSLLKGCFPSLCDGVKKRPYCYYKQLSFLLDTEFKKYVPDDVDISATKLRRPSPVDKERPRPDFRIVRPEKDKYSHPRPFNLTLKKDKTFEREDSSASCHSSISMTHNTSIPEPDNVIHKQRADNLALQNTLMPDPGNPDCMFFLSILPRVSALNCRDKLDFQINIMKLLQGYETDDSSS